MRFALAVLAMSLLALATPASAAPIGGFSRAAVAPATEVATKVFYVRRHRGPQYYPYYNQPFRYYTFTRKGECRRSLIHHRKVCRTYSQEYIYYKPWKYNIRRYRHQY